MKNFIAQSKPLGTIGGEGLGPFGKMSFPTAEKAGAVFADILSKVIGILTIIAGLWFMFQLFIGAFGYLASSGDKQAVESAKSRIQNSLIGLTVIILAWSILSLVSKIFGLDILHPEKLIPLLGPK